MKKIIASVLITTLTIVVYSQNQLDALRYSQTYFGGTARSMGMAGAFGSAGADFSTSSSNPAGLGLYKSSEFTFSPSFYSGKTLSEYNNQSSDDQKFNFNINNLGLVFNFDTKKEDVERPGWNNVQFSFGLNRLNNFNNRTIIQGDSPNSSLLNLFTSQANGNTSDNLDRFGNALAFDTWLIDTFPVTNSYYSVIPDGGVLQRKLITTTGGSGSGGNGSNKGGNGGNGVYSLVAYNGSCAAPAVNTANISVKPAPIADAGPDHSVVECGKIIGGNPTASGGVSPYTYQWSPTTALSSYTVANPTASPSSTTAYTVTVTGANGCASTSSMTLTIGNGTPVVFNSSQSWVVPAGVTCVQIEVWGGGGGGGGAAAGCGGGGGGYGRQNFNVTPGQSLNITVGAGGPGGGSYKGTNGNTSSVNGTGIAISATGGSAGSGGKCSGSPPGGTSTATINVTGGSGSGGNGSNKGGNGGNGGNGGSGGSGTTGYGNPGQIPGGGGGGGGVYGGDGANGRVTISY
jgi:hypothetical protein